MKIVLTYNLKRQKSTITKDEEAEFDSRETIEEIQRALQDGGHRVTLIEANELAFNKFFRIRKSTDLVFNIAEGKVGESRESIIPIILEQLRIPYTGSGPLTLAICLNKGITKKILDYHKIPTPLFQILNNHSDKLNKELQFPLFLKPNEEGSSRGIYTSSVVNTSKQFRKQVDFLFKKYHQKILVEEFLPGREFSVAILGNPDNEVVFPIIELDFKKNRKSIPIDTFESKHIWELPSSYIICPAKIPKKLAKEIINISLKTYRVLECRDLARIDIRLDQHGKPQVLEINPLPAIGDKYLDGYPKAAAIGGFDYSSLINSIVQLAAKRYKLSKH